MIASLYQSGSAATVSRSGSSGIAVSVSLCAAPAFGFRPPASAGESKGSVLGFRFRFRVQGHTGNLCNAWTSQASRHRSPARRSRLVHSNQDAGQINQHQSLDQCPEQRPDQRSAERYRPWLDGTHARSPSSVTPRLMPVKAPVPAKTPGRRSRHPPWLEDSAVRRSRLTSAGSSEYLWLGIAHASRVSAPAAKRLATVRERNRS